MKIKRLNGKKGETRKFYGVSADRRKKFSFRIQRMKVKKKFADNGKKIQENPFITLFPMLNCLKFISNLYQFELNDIKYKEFIILIIEQ